MRAARGCTRAWRDLGSCATSTTPCWWWTPCAAWGAYPSLLMTGGWTACTQALRSASALPQVSALWHLCGFRISKRSQYYSTTLRRLQLRLRHSPCQLTSSEGKLVSTGLVCVGAQNCARTCLEGIWHWLAHLLVVVLALLRHLASVKLSVCQRLVWAFLWLLRHVCL